MHMQKTEFLWRQVLTMVQELTVGWRVGLIPELSRVQGDCSCGHTAKGNSQSAPSQGLWKHPKATGVRHSWYGKRRFHPVPNPSSLVPHREGRENQRQTMRREAKEDTWKNGRASLPLGDARAVGQANTKQGDLTCLDLNTAPESGKGEPSTWLQAITCENPWRSPED